MNSVLISSRWQLTEFVFVEYRKSAGILVDIGPFPKEPDDAETDKAFTYLTEAQLDFLSLGDKEWILDVPKLGDRFPVIKTADVVSSLSHPPAFELASHLGLRGDPSTYFLRIYFAFSPTAEPPLETVMEAEETESETSETGPDKGRSGDNNLFYYYSEMSLEACRQKLMPYVPKSAGSSVIEAPFHPHEFVVSLNTLSFTVKRTASDDAGYHGWYSANLSSDKDGGTLITGQYGAGARDSIKGVLPYVGMVVSIGLGFKGLDWWTQMSDVSMSNIFWGGCLAFAGALGLFGFLGWVRKNNRKRLEAWQRDQLSILDFVQNTLKAEPIDIGEEEN